MGLSLLAIDTSGSYTEIAIRLRSGEIITSSTSCINSHDEELASLVKSLITSAQLDVCELDGIVLGAGPGSFTGLRIGSAFAKGLAISSNVALYQVGTLDSLVWQGACQNCVVVTLADARRDEWFYTLNIVRDGIPLKLEGAAILGLNEIYNLAKNIGEREALSVFGVSLVPIKIEPAKYDIEIKTAEKFGISLIRQFDFELSSGLLKRAKKSGDYACMVPMYVRAVAAKTIKERTIKEALL